MLVLYVIAASILLDAGDRTGPGDPAGRVLRASLVALADRVVFEQAEQRRILVAMGRYLPPSVSRWVLADPRRLRPRASSGR